jgi:ATP/maltotriose-dependent transcriptional regulator MalT
MAPTQDELFRALSKRELEILRLICEGCSNQEIAEQLVITLHTVRKHSSNIFDKLGVCSRTQAGAPAEVVLRRMTPHLKGFLQRTPL